MNVLVVLSTALSLALCTKRARESDFDSQNVTMYPVARHSGIDQHGSFTFMVAVDSLALEDKYEVLASLHTRALEFVQNPCSIYCAQILDRSIHELCMSCGDEPDLQEKIQRALKVTLMWTACGTRETTPTLTITSSGLWMTRNFDFLRYGSGMGFRPHQVNKVTDGGVVPVEGLTGDTTLCLLHAALCQAIHPSILQQVSKGFYATTRLDAVFKFPGTFERVVRNLAYTNELWPFMNALINGRGPFGVLDDDQRATAASLFTDVPMSDLLQFLVVRRVELGEPVGDSLIQSVILGDKSPKRMAELKNTLTENVPLDGSPSKVRKVINHIKQLASNTTDAASSIWSLRN